MSYTDWKDKVNGFKKMEKQGKARDEINQALKEKFADKKTGEFGGKGGC